MKKNIITAVIILLILIFLLFIYFANKYGIQHLIIIIKRIIRI